MQLEYESVEEVKKKILAIVAKYLSLDEFRVFFFGSRVSGTASERSDIDVGIEGPTPIPLEVLSKIREAVDDLPILYKIDVIDFHRVSNDFREVALQHVEPLTLQPRQDMSLSKITFS